jgi:general secretion pathway protein A
VTDPPRRSLADDPLFLESLADLDYGVSVDASPAASPPPDETTAARHRPLLELFPLESDTRRPAPPPVATGRPFDEGEAEPPFSLSTDPRFFFQSSTHDRAIQQLLTSIRARERVALLTGERGSGKTLVCRTLIEELDRRTLTSVVEHPFTSAEQMLKTVLLDFGVVSRNEAGGLALASAAALWGALADFLATIAPLHASALVIIDDAQHLSAEMLDQIRLLAAAGEGEGLIQVLIVGEAGLLPLLQSPVLEALRGQIKTRVALGALDPGEVLGYVSHRMRTAGRQPTPTFASHTAQLIFDFSDGNPRAINLLCERALRLAGPPASPVVDAPAIRAAAAELGLEPRVSTATRPRRGRLAAAALLLTLAALGAAAAFVFRDQLLRLF